MTTATETQFRAAGPAGRILNVVRLNVANPWTTIIMPWLILGIIFLANLTIWWIIFNSVGADNVADVSDGLQYSGASTWIFVYMTVVAIQAINLTFPFALGYGVTRRDFWLGSSVTFVLLSAMYAVGMTILSVIEETTNGWGLGGHMFTAVFFGDTWLQRLFIYFVAFLFFFFFGAAIATVYVRWRANGVTLFFVVLAALLIAGAAVLTLTGNWQVIGDFFARTGLVGSFAWSLVITVISGFAGYLILRRATPKN
ncbi:MAG: transporter permease [Rhodoglobus sp.]|nr:transporter permease [Rhodoglobus sp.]